jgi:hypothetical protein
MIAVAAALSAASILFFIATWLALRHVRPAWLLMRFVLGRWASFTVEMDGRGHQDPAQGDISPSKQLPGEQTAPD